MKKLSKATPTQLLNVNREAAHTVNSEIALYAGEFSHHFLAGCFPSMMYVERSSEIAEPGPFDLSMEPDRLETRRMTARHWRHFDLALVNEELLARRYVKELEYEFVLVLDISRSLTGTWNEAVAAGTWQEHPCYRLKYLAYALLNSAVAQDFTCRVIFVDQGRTVEVASRDDDAFPFAVIEQMDGLVGEDRPAPERMWMLDGVLRRLGEAPENLVVAVVSDFLDPVQDHGEGAGEELMLSALSRLRYGKRLLVLQVSNDRDLKESLGKPESLQELTYAEEPDKRLLSLKETLQRRSSHCLWLGKGGDDAGRLGAHLALENVPYERFVRSDDINQRLETLACSVVQA